MTRKRFTTILLVTLVLMSMVSVTFTGTVGASADERLQECDVATDETGGFISDIYVAWYEAATGEQPLYNCNDVTSVSGATADEVQSEIYSDSGTFNQGSNSINEVGGTLSTNGQNAIWSEAKVEIYEAHEAGKAESVAKQNARKVVNSAYSDLSNVTLNRMTTMANALLTDIETINQTENLTFTDVFDSQVSPDASQPYPVNDSYTLPNGNSYNYTNVHLGGRMLYEGTESLSYGKTYLKAKPVDTELSNAMYLDGAVPLSQLSNYSDEASNLRTQVETLANDTYQNYDQGQINASEYLSPSDVASQYDLSANNGSAYTAATAAMLGYDTAANSSVTIEYVDTGATVSGSLFADSSPPTTYEVSTGNNTTTNRTAWIPDHVYAVSTMNATAYLATESGEFNELTSDFKILSIEDAATGDALNYTAPVRYTGINTSATAPTNLDKQLQDLAAALDNRTVEDDGGIGFPDLSQGDGTIVMVLMVLGGLGALVVLVVVAVAAMRSGSGGSGSTYNDYGGGR